jgi:hypothetical protein
MRIVITIISVSLILAILMDAFEVVVLPRRVTRRFRMARFFYRATWIPSSALTRRLSSSKRRETYLSFFGPLSLILLLSVWAVGLIVGFGALHWSLNSPISIAEGGRSFGSYLYLSGTTFFTLGYGDVTPVSRFGRALAVVEAGVGFGFLALIIGYLPVIYQAFSRREAIISLLDARAGSPPSAGELLRRHAQHVHELDALLHDWERWAADLMESHLSYPVLCYYRSQHNNQSWLMALTTILDVSAMVMVGIDGASKRQAELTFAMARHAVVDLAQIFNAAPKVKAERLPPDRLKELRSQLAAAGLKLTDGEAADKRMSELRQMYEPFVEPLSEFFLLALPRWAPAADAFDNWQTSAWGRISTAIEKPGCARVQDEEHSY